MAIRSAVPALAPSNERRLIKAEALGSMERRPDLGAPIHQMPWADSKVHKPLEKLAELMRPAH